MHKTILITGATDGIGLATARLLVEQGHRVLLHGRSAEKLAAVQAELAALPGATTVAAYEADLSDLQAVEKLIQAVTERHSQLDVLINNAGIFRTPHPVTRQGLDVRFVVNTLAPYRLTRGLLPLLGSDGRVINLSSAAQAPVDLDALSGQKQLSDMGAYAQSKLALTQWSRHLAQEMGAQGPAIIAVNPGSMLGSKMVKEGFGVTGGDLNIGARILLRAALDDEFAAASGQYFDNDSGRFAAPHSDAFDERKTAELMQVMDKLLADART